MSEDEKHEDEAQHYPQLSEERLSDLRESSIRCRELLHQLSIHDGARVRDQMASFNIWAANMGVFRQGQQSIASRLSSAAEISKLVQQLLDTLKRNVEKELSRKEGEEESSSDSQSVDSSDRSSISSYKPIKSSRPSGPSEPSEDDDVAPSHSRTWTSIENIITSLRQLAITVQRAGNQHRRERTERFKSNNEELYRLFERCARQKVQHLFPNASTILKERMAWSVATRRIRFLYLNRHQKKISTLGKTAPPLQREPEPTEAVHIQATSPAGYQETRDIVSPSQIRPRTGINPKLEQHITNVHGNEVSESLRSTIVKHSKLHDQPALQDCPFCGGFPEELEEKYTDRDCREARKALEKHVEQHFITVALVLVPIEMEHQPDDENDDENSEAQRDNRSELDLDGIDVIPEVKCSNDDCDCKDDAKDSPLDRSAFDDDPSYSDDVDIQDEWEFRSDRKAYQDLADDMKLREYFKIETVQDAMEEIPADLSDLFSQSWSSIVKLSRTDKERAISLIQLATFSFRPLTVREISEAVLASEEVKDLPSSELPDQWDEIYVKERILDPCYSLLEARKQSPESPVEEWTIHLTHSSFKECYILQLDEPPAYRLNPAAITATLHSILARICITHLGYPHAWLKSTGDVGSFTDYAARFWNKHAEAGTPEIRHFIEYFFDDKASSWIAWRFWFDSTNDGWAGAKSDGDPAIPLCYAMELGFVEAAMAIIDKGEDRFNYNSSSRTALGVASSKGYEELARILVAQGAEVGVRDAHGRAAIHYAAMNGRLALVQFLIDNGADVNLQDDNGVSPFLAASANGHLSVMRQLIQNDADIHQLDKDGNDALFQASSNDHIEAARFLIEKGAHRQLSSYLSTSTTPPIFAAMKNSSSNMALLLLELEEDVNVKIGTKRQTILHVAISEGQTDIAKLLIDNVDLALQDADRQTPLFVACVYGRTEIVELLIQHKVNIMTPDKKRTTPLHAACANRHLEVARLLIDNGADATKVDVKGNTALAVAALAGALEIVRMFFEQGEGVSADYHSALLGASAGGHVDIVKLLIKWRDSESITGPDSKNSALMNASRNGHAGVVSLLLEVGAELDSPDAFGGTPLYEACRNGHLEVARLLVEKGADVNAATQRRQTPLMATCQTGSMYVDLAALLLDKGADINALNIDEMNAAFVAAESGQLEVLRLLLSRGADIFHRTVTGLLPIHVASQRGHSETVDLLIENGSDATVIYKDGNTPLILATIYHSVDVITVLLKHGAHINTQNVHGQTPLLIASRDGDAQIAELLVDHRANVSVADAEGRTPLFFASSNGHLEIVKLLLSNGADMTPNHEGRTPYDMASTHGHAEILELLGKPGS
ncbi:hypothetical protein MKX08_008162 [Trichoderma sp. CBMAI-0020]|nr:hypothetical protein MKX08_008162 [Trichoderma sp. CBMAI-0020]